MSLSDEHKNIWNDINLSLKLFTAICNNLPLQTIAIFEDNNNGISYWKILCNFIKYIIQNSEKEQKMWILAQRLLKLILNLVQSDPNKLSNIFIEHKLLHYFRDIVESNINTSKKQKKISNKIQYFIHCIIHQVLC